MRVLTAQAMFSLFAGVMGLSQSWIFLLYTQASITKVFFITAATFAGMSLYGYTTRRDLTGIGSFLIMGLWGLILASVVNLFLGSSALDFAISAIGVLVFTGLTAYDSQRIKESYVEGDSHEVATKKAIYGAFQLYLDFINLFIMLLRLFGSARN
jgi:FtsH-binding integral membrane protein